MPSKASEGKVCMVSSNFRLMFGPTGLCSFRREALNSEHPGPKPEEHRKHACRNWLCRAVRVQGSLKSKFMPC